MPDDFKVIRYGFAFTRDGTRIISKPLYDSKPAAGRAAKADRQRFPEGKARAVEIDLTDVVKEKVFDLANHAVSGLMSRDAIEKEIIEIIQFTQRGY